MGEAVSAVQRMCPKQTCHMHGVAVFTEGTACMACKTNLEDVDVDDLYQTVRGNEVADSIHTMEPPSPWT